jgi:glutathione S-transferase
MYSLYVIPGSHACRSAMLMLQHKGVPYRRVDFITCTHAVMARRHGFDAGGEIRVAGGRRSRMLRGGDQLGTVPALAANGDRISTNRQIARFLDERHPEPALFPADPERRRAVEEAERWANGQLQMEARRIPLAWVVREPAEAARSAAKGRMGYLLYRRELARRLITPMIGRLVFSVDKRSDGEVMAGLPALLDRVDALIADGVLGGEQLNAADFMVAPSLALILYRPDTRPYFEGRPALALVDRLLPEPA